MNPFRLAPESTLSTTPRPKHVGWRHSGRWFSLTTGKATMGKTRGPAYKWSDFIGRSLPRKGTGSYNDLFVHHVIEFLKTLDDLQADNPRVTITIQAGGSVNVHYKGVVLCVMKPAIGYLRLILPSNRTPEKELFHKKIKGSKENFLEALNSKTPGVVQWRCRNEELLIISQFLNTLPSDTEVVAGNRDRYFPGAVRQAALEAFEESGRICPGVVRKRHKVGMNEELEFDHILPWAKGGASSFLNIQILCVECNRRKRDSAR
jgi:HNH endonuclease